jgi:hypothetical protein
MKMSGLTNGNLNSLLNRHLVPSLLTRPASKRVCTGSKAQSVTWKRKEDTVGPYASSLLCIRVSSSSTDTPITISDMRVVDAFKRALALLGDN